MVAPDPMPPPAGITLARCGSRYTPSTVGERSGDALLAEVYDQLRAIARHRLASESPDHTLQATALVHEAWMKLSHRESVMQLDRAQFVITAAEAMRRILIDHARTAKRVKRGGGEPVRRLVADVADLASADRDGEQIVALDEALRRYEQEDAQAAQVVKLRFFAGLSIAETAEVLGLSERTVKRDWQFARVWLFRALTTPTRDDTRAI